MKRKNAQVFLVIPARKAVGLTSVALGLVVCIVTALLPGLWFGLVGSAGCSPVSAWGWLRPAPG